MSLFQGGRQWEFMIRHVSLQDLFSVRVFTRHVSSSLKRGSFPTCLRQVSSVFARTSLFAGNVYSGAHASAQTPRRRQNPKPLVCLQTLGDRNAH